MSYNLASSARREWRRLEDRYGQESQGTVTTRRTPVRDTGGSGAYTPDNTISPLMPIIPRTLEQAEVATGGDTGRTEPITHGWFIGVERIAAITPYDLLTIDGQSYEVLTVRKDGLDIRWIIGSRKQHG